MSVLRRWRVLLVLKPFDVYPPRPVPTLEEPFSSSAAPQRVPNPKILRYLDDRCKVHKETISFCQDVLQQKSLEWQSMLRNNLSQPIRDVDIVVTVGGDGTLLQASHFMDGTIPVIGVNSDPTQSEEVENLNNEFDATRSTGYLCAARRDNFEQVLDEILEGHKVPSELSRISIGLNGCLLPTFALNDVLVAHPCPATVSRFSFRIECLGKDVSSLVNCRSSGLRVSTAAGSTAAMLSAGGFSMPISSQDLQYMLETTILIQYCQLNGTLVAGVIMSGGLDLERPSGMPLALAAWVLERVWVGLFILWSSWLDAALGLVAVAVMVVPSGIAEHRGFWLWMTALSSC